MRCVLENSGQRVETEFSDANVRDIFLPLLARLTALRRQKGRRVVALLAAPPGAGKSTLAAMLEALSRETPGVEPLTALGMDGFHRRRDYLESHTVERGGARVSMASVKGAPETFDLEALARAFARVAAGEDCPWPRYDRARHDPAEGSAVTGEIVLVEGNYLLLDAPGWRDLRERADYTAFIGADPAVLRRRLVARHVAGGRSPEEAAAFVDASDMANARLCLERSGPADLRLRLLDDDTFIPISI